MAAAKFNMLIAAKTAGTGGIKRMGNSMQGLQGRLKNVRLAALSVNTAFKAMALILTAGTFSRFVTGAINQADAFGKLSRQTGVAADQLQAYVNAGKLAGDEQATIEKGLRRLAQSQREADQGVKTYSESYEALGVSVRDADGNLKSSEVLLADISDRFRDMPDGATKAALAMEIFGRSGAQLIPMLNEGGEALERWNYETSEGFAANAEYFNDQITMLGFGFDGFRKQLADALLPTLNNLLNMFSNIFSSQNDWDALFKGIEVGLKVISSAVFTVVAGFRFLLTTIKSIAEGLGELSQGNFGAAGQAFKGGLKETNEQFKLLPEDIQDWSIEKNNKIWLPIQITLPLGMLSPSKIDKEMKWTFFEMVDIPENLQEQYPDGNGGFYNKRYDMESPKIYDSFLEAMSELNSRLKSEVENVNQDLVDELTLPKLERIDKDESENS